MSMRKTSQSPFADMELDEVWDHVCVYVCVCVNATSAHLPRMLSIHVRVVTHVGLTPVLCVAFLMPQIISPDMRAAVRKTIAMNQMLAEHAARMKKYLNKRKKVRITHTSTHFATHVLPLHASSVHVLWLQDNV